MTGEHHRVKLQATPEQFEHVVSVAESAARGTRVCKVNPAALKAVIRDYQTLVGEVRNDIEHPIAGLK